MFNPSFPQFDDIVHLLNLVASFVPSFLIFPYIDNLS